VRIWVGLRESDVQNTSGFFERSITLFGSGENGNHTISKKERNRRFRAKSSQFDQFVVDKMLEIIHDNPYSEFMFYNSKMAYRIISSCPRLRDNIVCLNSQAVLDFLSDKLYCRLWVSNIMTVIQSVVLTSTDCDFQNLSKIFLTGSKKYVIQESNSSGGTGTFLLNMGNNEQVKSMLKTGCPYLVSGYIENSIPINIHIVIIDEQVFCLQGSIQILELSNNNLLYHGADFFGYHKFISKSTNEKIKTYAIEIGSLVKTLGYRGIFGIDFLICDEKIIFVEINPRFQGSTHILNRALESIAAPSLQEIHYYSFFNNKNHISTYDTYFQVTADLSFYRYEYDNLLTSNDMLAYTFDAALSSDDVICVQADGYESNIDCENLTYAFQIIFNKNIASPNADGTISMHPNIPTSKHNINLYVFKTDSKMDIIKLKIALLNQGVKLTNEAIAFINHSGGINESVFSSIDIVLFNNIRVNCPIHMKFSDFSPFIITYNGITLSLSWLNLFICDISIESKNFLPTVQTKNLISYDKIAFLSGDRLRIKHEQKCYYKENDKGCMFCGSYNKLTSKNNNYTEDDIKEVIDYCITNMQFRHVMIGGGSPDPNYKKNNIIDTIKYIRSKSKKPIYLMTTPPINTEVIHEYYKAGLNEIAFNIEIFDRNLAASLMPNKGNIPLKQYYDAFKYSVELFGNSGNVRSMLVVGLEKTKTLLDGIEQLCKLGVQPILSIFRPLNSCKLNHIMPPSNDDLFHIYESATMICQRHGQILGPTCISCQNNTLSFG